MTTFDPHSELGLRPEATEAEVREAYRRRLVETDPSRVRGMDPSIEQAARQARYRVEVAHRLLSDPDSVDASELPVEPGAPGAPSEDLRKSYLKALLLTMTLPGAGSRYAGGSRRGLMILGLVAVCALMGVRSVEMAKAALPAGADYVARLMTISELTPWLTSAYVLALADAMLAVWAHNDRL